jgi:short-subunit dehydrogenase
MLNPSYGMALVTGASGGIGREFALQLSRAGWRLILVGRNADRLAETRRALDGRTAEESVEIRADLSERGSAAALHEECARRALAVELLVNNAGAGLFGECANLPIDGVEAMLGLNILSLTTLCALFGSDMRSRGSGKILNVGSLAGNFALPYFASYAASKSYVLSYSLALRAELRPSGVSVSCVLPGYVRTLFDESAGIASPAYRSFSERNGMKASAVARSGLGALARDRPYAAAGLRNKITAALSILVPRSALPALAKPLLDRMTRGSKS